MLIVNVFIYVASDMIAKIDDYVVIARRRLIRAHAN